MTQWRGMSPPGSRPTPERRYGLVGAMKTLDYFSPGLGIDELHTRGWTEKLVEKFLGDEDRRDSVAHWANFSGKKIYLIARVETAEAMPEFEADFILSARRRKLSQEFVEATLKRCRDLRSGKQSGNISY